MNALNENHDPTQPDDLHDRLLDSALNELVGGHAPPDLSSRIAAATIQQAAAIAQVPRTRQQDRAFWVNLAIAVTLLIGVSVVLLPQFSHVRDKAPEVVALTSHLQNAHNSAQPLPAASTAPLEKTRIVSELDKSGPLGTETKDVLQQLSVLKEKMSSAAKSANPHGDMDLVISQTQSLPEVQVPAQGQPGRVIRMQQNVTELGDQQELQPTRQFGGEFGGPQPGEAIVARNDSFYYKTPHEDDVEAATDGSKGFGPGYRWFHAAERTGRDSLGDKYTQIIENPFIKAEGGAAVSTFSIDVDTASYANVRQFLLGMNQLPPSDAVRIEELVNYFNYDYAPPKAQDDAPFAAHVEVASCPWNVEHRLARIAVKGREMDRNKRPQSNLVFLVDVSGSMNEPAKLPLVVYGLEQLTHELGENDHIAIVVYAGTEGVVLPSTSGSKQDTILAALGKLQAGGSTAGGAGIQLAYQIAEENFIKGGTNRVILCTDGDFNVGVTNTADLQRMVEKKAKDTGVFLSTLGFGRGNLNDAMMLAISDHGNGNYHYIDNRIEARRVLVKEMTGTLVTIAKDVKIQVEFNPAKVAGYRLIGYEKRMLRTEDFNDDKKDAGEIGAGHTVTALYEIVPADAKVEVGGVDELKYQKPATATSADATKKVPANASNELLTLKMRYKAPDGDTSKKLEWPINDDGKSFSAASGDLKFAASVAGFGLLLRNSQFKGNLTFAAAIELAQGGIGDDPHGYRKEFLEMIRKAKELRHE